MDNGLVRVLVFCILISETVLILFVMDNGLVQHVLQFNQLKLWS